MQAQRITFPLYLRDFFEHFDPADPYHLSSLSELQEAIKKADPSILQSSSPWFKPWQWGGKR